MNTRPNINEYAEYYNRYIKLVPDGDITVTLDKHLQTAKEFLSKIGDDKANFRYAPDKWSVKEVLGHVIDGELVFGYRALRFSRKDQNRIPGFEQNDYVANSNYKNILMKDLIDEFVLRRQGNIIMFKGFTEEMWLNKGIASNNEISVRAIAYIIAGHSIHHLNVLKEKYGC